MLDSLLTLTKGEAFWLAVGFVTALLVHFGVSALTGTSEPIFLLIALAIPAFLLVAGAYTIGKLVVKRTRRGQNRDAS